jgi:hypothetical protein
MSISISNIIAFHYPGKKDKDKEEIAALISK